MSAAAPATGVRRIALACPRRLRGFAWCPRPLEGNAAPGGAWRASTVKPRRARLYAVLASTSRGIGWTCAILCALGLRTAIAAGTPPRVITTEFGVGPQYDSPH